MCGFGLAPSDLVLPPVGLDHRSGHGRGSTDPQYSWAAEILNDRGSRSQLQRAELLYERTLDYRSQVCGPRDAYTLKALRNIQALAQRL